MNLIEQLTLMANKGELAEPSKVVECANQIKFDTDDYSDDGQKKGNNNTPVIVDAETIRKEMEKGYRPTSSEPIVNTSNMPFIIDNIKEED